MELKNAANNLNDIKEKAGDVLDNLSKNKDLKNAADKAIDAVEKKAKVDLPNVDGLKKMLD